MLPKWWQLDGDVLTAQNINLCRESTGLNLERFVRGEDLFDEAGNPATNPRAEFAAIFELGKAKRGELDGVEYAYRVLPGIVRFTELQEKLGELKLIKDLRVANGVIDVAANTISRISATDETKMQRGCDHT